MTVVGGLPVKGKLRLIIEAPERNEEVFQIMAARDPLLRADIAEGNAYGTVIWQDCYTNPKSWLTPPVRRSVAQTQARAGSAYRLPTFQHLQGEHARYS